MTTGRLPKISIVTPSFNQGEYLEETLLSVLDQGYPELQYIVIDGGSSDLSPLMIDRYRDRLAHVRIGPDKGQYHALQEGIGHATGELIAWINSDDKYHAGSLWRMAEAAERFPDAQWFTGLPSVWNGYGKLHYINTNPPEWTHAYLRNLPNDPQPWYIQQESTFFRRSLWEAAGATFDLSLSLAADYELWLRFTRIQQVRQLKCLIGGFRIQPKQRSSVQKTRYGEEVLKSIGLDQQACRVAQTRLSPTVATHDEKVSQAASAPAYLHRLDADFVLATSIAPHKQYVQYKAVQTWIDAGFSVRSFNEPAEIDILRSNFPQVEFVAADRTARSIVGKPLVFISDVLAYFVAQGHQRCGIVNSDISFISTTGIVDALAAQLRDHDALFSSRIEVDQPGRQVVESHLEVGLPSVRFGSIYAWGFDLFVLNRRAVESISGEMSPDSPFAFGVPWWDYLVPTIAMRLKLRTGVLNPPPISHPTHPANYDWRLWQMYGHVYLATLGLSADAIGIQAMDKFVPKLADEQLQTISQQFVQMLVRGSSKIDLGHLVHLPNSMPFNLGYGEMSEDVIRQLGLANAYGSEPFLNLSGYLRDQFSMSEDRRTGIEMLGRRGMAHV